MEVINQERGDFMTDKQKRFVDEYLIDLNATQAAIRAGYSEKTARYIGYENLTKPHISNAIQERMEQLEDVKIASIKEILEYLTAAMRGEIQEEVVVLEGWGDGCTEARIITKQISARDRLKAAELLGKRYNLFSDKFSMELTIPVVISGEDDLE